MTRMRTLAIVCLCLARAAYPAVAAKSDAKSVAIAEAMVQAMGGQNAWNSAHFLRFDFKVSKGGKEVASRTHLWDKRTGRYRLDDSTKEGAPRTALMNLANREGSVYVGGKKLEGAESAKALKDAYASYTNDVYWLMMPWKWLDSGVHLKYVGQQKGYDVVELTFDHVGLTPGDMYHAFVSPKTHMMEHWEYTLQSGNKGSWDWQYGEHKGVKLASNHTNDQGMSINMGSVDILDSVPDDSFTNPAKK